MSSSPATPATGPAASSSQPRPAAVMPDAAAIDRTLRIHEIYASVQGESTWAGLPCTFVRLTGCPLRCVWCDTEYAFHGGESRTIASVIEETRSLGVPLVEVTGGEPLAQPRCATLLHALAAPPANGGPPITVLLETAGSHSLAPVPREVRAIMDIKCPDSGEEARNRWENIELLLPHDEVKFVIASRRDYEFARNVTREHGLYGRVRAVLFSPVWGAVEPAQLVEWTLADGLHGVRVQVQMHKVIWSPETKGV